MPLATAVSPEVNTISAVLNKIQLDTMEHCNSWVAVVGFQHRGYHVNSGDFLLCNYTFHLLIMILRWHGACLESDRVSRGGKAFYRDNCEPSMRIQGVIASGSGGVIPVIRWFLSNYVIVYVKSQAAPRKYRCTFKTCFLIIIIITNDNNKWYYFASQSMGRRRHRVHSGSVCQTAIAWQREKRVRRPV